MSCQSTSLSARGHADPPRADCTVCTSYDKHARRPPFFLARGSVRDQSADICARGKFHSLFERACFRNPNELLRAIARREERLRAAAELRCVRELRRELFSPQLYLEALGRSQRVLGLLLRLFISSSWTARSPFLRGPALIAYAEQPPGACNGQAVFSSIEAFARSTPTNGCCSRRKEECACREENLLAGDRSGKNQVGSGIGKKDGECSAHADHHKCAGSEGYSSGKCRPGCMETFSPAS
jgi:hypothetical protein